MTPESFIAKWAANTRPERAVAAEHFNDLCDLLGQPRPNDDPDGTDYAFEKGVTKSGGGRGFADVWKRGCFAMEYKSKGGDLNAAFVQLQRYALALESPPLLVVCDIERTIIRTTYTSLISATYEIALAELANPAKRQWLTWMMTDPDRLRPNRTRQALTEEAADGFARLAQDLRGRGHPAGEVAHFVNRVVFCLFADHTTLLPSGLLEQLFTLSLKNPGKAQGHFARLFAGVAEPDGALDFITLPWFNGGLFNDAAALPLLDADIRRLQRVRRLDWSEIDVSIFGTLFERGLDPGKRAQLGAHYTDGAKIGLIIEPVIERPLKAEWAAALDAIDAALTKPKGRPAAQAIYAAFVDRLAAYRVLDPACGSGNFLYLAVQRLQDIEHRAGLDADARGLQRQLPRVGPEAVLGIEVNPFAAELARVSVWIGHIQWARRNGMPLPHDPVLRTLDTIECRDAVLAPDGTRAAWPRVDAIVGNPPFLGDKRMRGVLGDAETDRLRAAYAGRVPGGADLVCYWFEQARAAVLAGNAARAGLVATNSIRGGANRAVLDAIVRETPIFEAWSDEPWTVEGAAVRVSLICFGTGAAARRLDGAEMAVIGATLGNHASDLTTANRLHENAKVCFQGTIKVGPFDVSGDTARGWLEEPANVNGRPNHEVVRPWRNSMHVLRRFEDAWVVDFGATMTEREASQFSKPFAHVMREVKPIREVVRNADHQTNWWIHGRARPAMRAAMSGMERYIVTPSVAKHRVFVWFSTEIVPDHQLYAITRDDDTTFGILHSRFHEAWSLRLCTWLGVGNDARYTPTTTFETFPFPAGLTPDIPAAAYAADPRAEAIAVAARALVAARDAWLNPPDLCDRVPDILPHLPPRIVARSDAAALTLKTRTLTRLYNARGTPDGVWLDHLHADLDAAVAAAYGWPADIPEADALAALLALNLSRPAR